MLIRDIGVPADAAVAVGEEAVELRASLSVAVHNMQLREAFWRARRGVDVVAAEVAAKIEGFLEREISKVLVAEGDDFALGDKECESVTR